MAQFQNQNIGDLALIISLVIIVILIMISHNIFVEDVILFIPLLADVPSDILYLTAAMVSLFIILTSSISTYRRIERRKKIIRREQLSKDIYDLIRDQGFVNIRQLAKKFNIKTNDIIDLISESLGKEFYLTNDGKTIIYKQYLKKIIMEKIQKIK